MPTHKPRLSEMSIRQLSWLARCAHETASKKLAEAQLEPVRTDGRTIYYDPRDALPLLLGVEKLDLSAERARLAREQADAQEMKNAEARGEYVKGEDVDLFLFRVCGGMAQRMSAIPTKAAPEVRATASDAEGQDVLRTHIDQALNEIADDCRAAGESVEARKRGEVRRSIVDPKGAERKRAKSS